MKVATWRGEDKFTIDEVPMPKLEAGLVIIKVDSAGVCGTDVHVTQGLFTEWKPPMVLGHEFSGVIVDVGQEVPSERIGERVVCLPQPGCGKCGPCKTWNIGHCEQLPRRAGSFAEYVMVDQNAAYILPEKLDLETASMVEPAACALSCVDSLGPQEKGFDALVIGTGLLGLFTVAFLKLRGAGRVIASEPNPIRREMARQFGADFVHDPSKSSVNEIVEELTDGTGVHVAVEAVGKPELVAKCVELARPRGHVLMVGVSPRRSPLMIDLFEMHFKEISLRGAMGAGNSFGAALNLFPKIHLEGVVGGRHPLEEIASVIQMSAAGDQVKFVIAPND